MKKYGLSFLFLLMAAAVFGQNPQKTSKVNLISSETLQIVSVANGKKLTKVHKGVFQQDFSLLRSDSALFDRELNMVYAYGHVNINQGDTLNIFSDNLTYNGNTKVAVLTDNVKMIDKDATLTTNYFTYNTATRIGIYTGGGKLVNKDNTLTSKNGYYFATSRDEYFRYDVVCTTPDAIIKTDTLRYNSGTRIAFFYGPTTITGTKDKDVLYTENGTYNTVNEQASFGKNNLYTQNTKTLKGDSLFYDRLKGYGLARGHVTFDDKEQKMTIKSGKGEYYKANENAVMTINPYMILVVQDSTKADMGKKAIAIATAKDSIKTVTKKLTLQGITDSVTKKIPVTIAPPPVIKKPVLPAATKPALKKAPNNVPAEAKLNIAAIKKAPPVGKPIVKAGSEKTVITPPELRPVVKQPPPTGKEDSIYIVSDTLETRILTFRELKDIQEKIRLHNNRDTSIKVIPPSIVYTSKNIPKVLRAARPNPFLDTISLHRPLIKPKPVVVKPTVVAPKIVAQKKPTADILKSKPKRDTVAKKVLSDTARIRIVIGHHNAKIFKTDLQAKSDSLFWSSSDSTIRCYVNPMIWTQGSQLSGDTITMQLKNKKLDNLDMYPAAFIVNIEKNDSLHFNQVGGKQIHGTFKNNKLNSMLVTGNAENIYFNRDTIKNVITQMQHSVSPGLRAGFKNGQLGIIAWLGKNEITVNPIKDVKEEDKILKNFIWKPKDRPISKEAILSSRNKLQPIKETVKKSTVMPVVKPPVKKPAAAKAKPVAIKQPPAKTVKDSVKKDTAGVKK